MFCQCQKTKWQTTKFVLKSAEPWCPNTPLSQELVQKRPCSRKSANGNNIRSKIAINQSMRCVWLFVVFTKWLENIVVLNGFPQNAEGGAKFDESLSLSQFAKYFIRVNRRWGCFRILDCAKNNGFRVTVLCIFQPAGLVTEIVSWRLLNGHEKTIFGAVPKFNHHCSFVGSRWCVLRGHNVAFISASSTSGWFIFLQVV